MSEYTVLKVLNEDSYSIVQSQILEHLKKERSNYILDELLFAIQHLKEEPTEKAEALFQNVVDCMNILDSEIALTEKISNMLPPLTELAEYHQEHPDVEYELALRQHQERWCNPKKIIWPSCQLGFQMLEDPEISYKKNFHERGDDYDEERLL